MSIILQMNNKQCLQNTARHTFDQAVVYIYTKKENCTRPFVHYFVALIDYKILCFI